MLTLYRIALYLGLPLVLLRLLVRALRDRRYFERPLERFGFGYGKERAGPPPGGVWIHAVSVGEVNTAAPLVSHLLRAHPHKAVTVTTMTPTGADRVDELFGGRVRHCYLPYDYPGAVRRFIGAHSPCLALVMETEIWPNLIARCRRRGVPLCYVNVRLSRRSHRGYRRFAKLIAPTLQQIDRFAVQTRVDAKRLARLGARADALSVTGSLKFDVAIKTGASERDAADALRGAWGRARPVWVAGSTHEGEEAQVLAAFARVRREVGELLLALAPRHPQRCKRVLRLCARAGYRVALRSRAGNEPISADTDIYLVDTLGELPMLLAAGDIAFIGGSLVPVGGHNVLEASAAGVPVVFGPQMFNFAEIADLTLKHAAGIQVLDGDELAEVVLRWLTDPALRQQYAARGLELVEKNRGALGKICGLIDAELEDAVILER